MDPFPFSEMAKCQQLSCSNLQPEFNHGFSFNTLRIFMLGSSQSAVKIKTEPVCMRVTFTLLHRHI